MKQRYIRNTKIHKRHTTPESTTYQIEAPTVRATSATPPQFSCRTSLVSTEKEETIAGYNIEFIVVHKE
jgi:hypothetical protein